jgi:hypothetical protein
VWLGGKTTDAPAKTKKIITYICYTKPRVMKINKKEYGMGGSTMEMYKSGGMLKALLKDPKQREMAKSMLQEFEEGGKITPEEMAIRDEIAATKSTSAAVPTKEDLMDAYNKTFADSANMPFEQFLARGVDDGDLEKLKAAAVAAAEKRVRTARGASKAPSTFEKRAMESGMTIGASYRPGSAEGEVAAGESAAAAVDAAIEDQLRKLGLK